MKLLLSTLIFMTLIAGNTSAQTYGWTQKANYGGGETYDPLCLVIGSKGYVGTGRALPGSNKNDFWQYDPATNIWTQMANFPGTGRYGAKGFSIGNYGFAGTGWDPSPKKDFYRYDPVLNTWTAISNFGGTARYTASTFSLGNKGYMGLGYSPCQSDFWQYDPALDTWAQVATFPGGARQAAMAVAAGNYGYVGFGVCDVTVYDDWYRYDPILNTWNIMATFPGPARSSAFAFSLADTIYVGMGNNAQNNPLPFTIFTDFWMYNTSTATWLQLADHPGGKRFAGAAFSINNKGYIGLGSDTIYSTHYRSDLWEYAPSGSTGLAESGSPGTISIFPNPATEWIEIVPANGLSSGDKIVVEIHDTRGRKCISHTVAGHAASLKLNVASLSPGLYSCNLLVNGKLSAAGRFTRK